MPVTGNGIHIDLPSAVVCCDMMWDEIEQIAHQQEPEVNTCYFHRMKKKSGKK
jgi:hypothetical protein